MATRFEDISDFSGGYVSPSKVNPLRSPSNIITAGENIDISGGSLKTRPGYTVMYDGASAPNNEIRTLKQVRFPTSELTYLVAQASTETTIEWTATDTLERSGHSLVYDVENGRYILFGGEDTSGYNNDTWSYDPDTDTWTEITTSGTPPSARINHVAEYVPALGSMVVHGGKDVGGATDDCFLLDLSTNAWTELTLSGDVPLARYYHSSCMIDGNTMMIARGRAGSYTVVGNVYDINLSTGVCTELDDSSTGKYRSSLAYDGSRYCYEFGGSGEDFFFHTGHRFDRTTNTWEDIDDLPEDKIDPEDGIADHCSFYCSGYVILCCGTGVVVHTYADSYLVYDTATGEWGTALPSGDLGTRKAAAGAMSDTGDIFIHGGEDETGFLSSGYIASLLCSADGAAEAISVGYGLYASSTHLPSSAVAFENIYSMSASAGVCGIETFGDRAIITEGVEHVPLVFSPGDLTADTYTSYAYPTRILANRNGSDNFEISQYVLDSDSDNAADIGGMTSWGELLICCDRPQVSDFYLEFDTPSTGGNDSTNQFDIETLFDANSKWVREDIKGTIDHWVQDSGATGHFEDVGDNPITIGTGNTEELVVAGVLVIFADGETTIATITDDGEGSGEVELFSEHTNADVSAIYALATYDQAIRTNYQDADGLAEYTHVFVDGTANRLGAGSLRIVIPATGGSNADYIRLTFDVSDESITSSYAPGVELNVGVEIDRASVVEQDSGWIGTTTPTELTFSGGASGFTSAKGTTVTTDLIAYAWDATKAHIVILDCPGTTVYHTASGGFSGMVMRAYEQNACVAKDVADASTGYVTAFYDGYSSSAATPTATLKSAYSQRTAVSKIETTGALVGPTNLAIAYTSSTGAIDLSFIEELKTVSVTGETPGDSTAWYAISFDNRASWYTYSDGWREFVRLYNATYWYYDNSETWNDTGEATPWVAFRAAFGETDNQMDGDQFNAIPAAVWGGVYGRDNINLLLGIQADSGDIPATYSWLATVVDTGQNLVEGWNGSTWTSGSGWTDGTTLFTQDGLISYDGGTFVSEHQTISGIPGYWFRIRSRGTSDDTTLTRVRYQGPTQPLANIGDGILVPPLAFIVYNGTTHATADYMSDVSDNTYSEFASALVPLETSDELYIGCLTPFNAVWLLPFTDNNEETSQLSATYWNGSVWVDLPIVDRTSDNSCTFAKAGEISFACPSDWKENVPRATGFEKGYYLKFVVSANLSTDTMISECRVAPVPEVLKKHRFVSQFQNRLILGGRPDAYAQIDISAPLLEYAFTGETAGAYNLGGDAITCMVNAWGTLMVGKVDRWFQLRSVTGSFDQDIIEVEAARHLPVNSQCIIKAPLAGFDDGSKSGLCFINRQGAWVVTGLQADQNFASARHQLLSSQLDWWDAESTVYPRLDLDYLHLACGEYWPVRNWLVWAVPMIVSGSSQTTNNRLIVFDLTLGVWHPPYTIAASSLTLAYSYDANAKGKLGEPLLLAGDYSGRILRLFPPDVYTDNGSAVACYLETAWLGFGDEYGTKLLRKIHLFGKTGADVTLGMYRDGSTELLSEYTRTETVMTNPTDQYFVHDFGDWSVKANTFKGRYSWTGKAEVFGMRVQLDGVRLERPLS